MLDFMKKYSMSILLAIIALNLLSIAGSLKTSAKLDYKKLTCLEGRDLTKKQLQKRMGTEDYIWQCNRLIIKAMP